MKTIKFFLVISLLFFAGKIFGQELPESYQATLNQIVTNFKTITSGNTIQEGKNVLSVINENKIALRIEHQKKVKNLTFITKTNSEDKVIWIPANPLTIDMVNKYEETVTKILTSMLELSDKKSKE